MRAVRIASVVMLLAVAVVTGSCGTNTGSSSDSTITRSIAEEPSQVEPSPTTETTDVQAQTAATNNEWELLRANRERAVQLLTQHRELREFLENELYTRAAPFVITRDTLKDKAAVGEYGKMIVEVFEVFGCERISIPARDITDGQKVLRILFNDIRTSNGKLYVQSLKYSREGAVENYESVFKDWYYVALLMT